jgi:hypothetical protein
VQPFDVTLGDVAHLAAPERRQHVEAKVACVLFRAPRLLMTVRPFVHVALGKLGDGGGLAVASPFLGGIPAGLDLGQQAQRLLARLLGRDLAMRSNGYPPCAAGRLVLHQVRSLAGREHAKAEAWQVIIPDEAVTALRRGGLDTALGDLRHRTLALLVSACGSLAEDCGSQPR